MPDEQAICTGFGTTSEVQVEWEVPNESSDEGWEGFLILLFGDRAEENWRTIEQARTLAINLNAACDAAEAHHDHLINEGLWPPSNND